VHYFVRDIGYPDVFSSGNGFSRSFRDINKDHTMQARTQEFLSRLYSNNYVGHSLFPRYSELGIRIMAENRIFLPRDDIHSTERVCCLKVSIIRYSIICQNV